jgi:hypothetical protein
LTWEDFTTASAGMCAEEIIGGQVGLSDMAGMNHHDDQVMKSSRSREIMPIFGEIP